MGCAISGNVDDHGGGFVEEAAFADAGRSNTFDVDPALASTSPTGPNYAAVDLGGDSDDG